MQRDVADGAGPGRGAAPETLLLSVLAFAAYALLRRFTAHGSDVFFLLRWLDDGTVHPQHPLYLVLARALRWALGPVTADGMTALALLSALGAAVGVMGTHRAVLVHTADRGLARWSALVVAALPAVVFYATIGELQAPFFGGAGVAAWLVARWLGAGTVRAAVGAGVAVAAATLLHATGHLLVPLWASAFWWAGRERAARARCVGVAVFAAVHAGVYALGLWLVRCTGPVLPGDPASFLSERAAVAAWLGFVPGALWWQWVLPFLPVSVLVVRRALWFWSAVAGYLLVSTMLARGADEVGGYLLPLAIPGAMLALLPLPRRAWPLVFAVAVLATGLQRALRPALAPDFGLAAAVDAAAEPTAWLVGDEGESWGARWRHPTVDLVEAWVTEVELVQRAGGRLEALDAPTLAAWLELTAAPVLAAHRRLVVTAHAVERLGARFPAFAAAWQRFAAAHHAEPIAVGAWRGFAVRSAR